MSVNEKMTAIADAIRDKTGKTEKLNLDDIANGVNEVYEVGKKAEYDAFWDSYQGYGRRRYYKYAFGGHGWTKANFKPKYDIIDTSGQNVFQESLIHVDLRERLNDLGVKLDTSKSTSMGYYFYKSYFTALPEISTLSAPSLDSCFRNSPYLTTIDKLILKQDGSQFIENAFGNLTKLENIVIEGVIGQNASFSSCPLTVASLVSIITHLKNYTGSTYAGKRTLTLKDSCKILMAEQGAMAELGGKTYDAYIADIGWNLA